MGYSLLLQYHPAYKSNHFLICMPHIFLFFVLFSIIVLPVLTTAPRVTYIDWLSARIEWDEWDGLIGDGPVVAYK